MVAVKQITDGTSNTILVLESSGKGVEEDGSRDNAPLTDEPSGAWASWKNVSSIKVRPEDPINGVAYSGINPPPEIHFWVEEFFSDHPGGVQVLLCDGSVHFLNEDTESRIYMAMCSRDGGELVSTADF